MQESSTSEISLPGGLMASAAFPLLFGLLAIMGYTETTREECTGRLWYKSCTEVRIPLDERLPWLYMGIGLFVLAAALLVLGLYLALRSSPRRAPKHRDLKRYEAILTGVETMSVSRIAAITDRSPAKVRREIDRLISAGELSDFYVDHAEDQVVSKKYVPKRSTKVVIACPGCGANNAVIVGIPQHCSFCGKLLEMGRN